MEISMYEETQMIIIKVLLLEIDNLYNWLGIVSEERVKYISFNLEQLNDLSTVLQIKKEYRERVLEDERIERLKNFMSKKIQ
jgi:hypothetical protein